MSITVGTDTYISIADATAYFTENYLSTDTKLVAWNLLSDDNKEVLLRQAAKVIDRQPLLGLKATTTQTMQFPRSIYSSYTMQLSEPLDVPEKVTFAQCEIAIELMSGPSKRSLLQQQGVKSFSLGKLSEAYTGNVNQLISQAAREYLAGYIAGSLRIV